MVKHRRLEKSAAAAVHKIQAQEDKSAASSDSALLAITSVCAAASRLPPASVRHMCCYASADVLMCAKFAAPLTLAQHTDPGQVSRDGLALGPDHQKDTAPGACLRNWLHCTNPGTPNLAFRLHV